MKVLSAFLILAFSCFGASAKDPVYQGSTPAHPEVKDFLGIPVADSIDFIRWHVVMYSNRYELDCRYGISRAGTNGFTDEKKAVFSGPLSKQSSYYRLQHGNKDFYVLEINPNLLHLLDKNKALLVGNGGYSYALNTDTPIKTDQFNFPPGQTQAGNSMAFQGRTPCQELAKIMGLDKTAACNKMKWYVILYTDAITGKPSYYLKGGRAYRKETMARGSWEITRGKDGRTIYKLDPEKKTAAVCLVKAGDNILFFTDPDGNLLVGNEDFSYTLNRVNDREP